MPRSAGPAIPQDQRNDLLARLEYSARAYPEINEVRVRFRAEFAYTSALLLDGSVQPLFRLRWEGDPDRWGLAAWADQSDRYIESRLQTGAATASPEDAMEYAYAARMSVVAGVTGVSGAPSPRARWWGPNLQSSLIDVCVYRRDPLFCHLEAWTHRQPAYLIAIFYAVLLLTVKVMATVLSGHLWSPTLGTDAKIDVTRFPPFEPISVLLGLGSRGVSSPSIPYLRDYSDIGVTAFLAANLAVLHKQWYQISSFTSDLWNLRALRQPKSLYQQFQRRCEAQFNSTVSYVACLLGAFSLSALILIVLTEHGMYFSLNPTISRAWERAAGQSWWAHPENSIPLFALELTWLFIMTYYVLRQNFVGVVAVSRGRELLRCEKEPVLLVTAYNVGAVVAIMRRLLVSIYASIMLTTASLVLLYFVLPQGVSRAVFLPFILLCLVCNPLYIFVPWRLFNQQLALSIEKERRRIKEARLKAIESRDEFALAKLDIQEEDVALIPRKVFATKWVGGVVGTYLPAAALYATWLLTIVR